MKTLTETHRAQLVAACEKFHGELVEGMRAVAPSSAEYKALVAQSDSVIATIRALGEEPSWMRARVS